MNHKLAIPFSALAAVSITVPAFGAAIITGATYSPLVNENPEPDTTAVTGLTDSDGKIYTSLIGATASNVTGTSNGDRYWAQNGSNPGSDAAALSGLTITNGVANFTGVTLDLNTTVNAGDDAAFFWIDFGTEGPMVFTPLDDNGDAIGSWSFTSSTFGTTFSPTFDLQGVVSSGAFGGITFTLDDFTGGTGTLTGVAGLQVTDNGLSDPAVFGVAVIPEPASLALLGLGGLCLLGRRRRD